MNTASILVAIIDSVKFQNGNFEFKVHPLNSKSSIDITLAPTAKVEGVKNLHQLAVGDKIEVHFLNKDIVRIVLLSKVMGGPGPGKMMMTGPGPGKMHKHQKSSMTMMHKTPGKKSKKTMTGPGKMHKQKSSMTMMHKNKHSGPGKKKNKKTMHQKSSMTMMHKSKKTKHHKGEMSANKMMGAHMKTSMHKKGHKKKGHKKKQHKTMMHMQKHKMHKKHMHKMKMSMMTMHKKKMSKKSKKMHQMMHHAMMQMMQRHMMRMSSPSPSPSPTPSPKPSPSPSPSSMPQIQFVVANSVTNTNGNNVLSLGSVQTGDLIVFAVSTLNNSTNVTDSLGNSYTRIGSREIFPGFLTVLQLNCWYTISGSSGSCTITEHESGTALSVAAAAYRNVDTVSPLDANVQGNSRMGPLSTGLVAVSGSHEIVIGVFAQQDGAGADLTLTPGAGFTKRCESQENGSPATYGLTIIDQINVSVGEAATATPGYAGSYAYGDFGLSFKRKP